jgi:hypothetical protein
MKKYRAEYSKKRRVEYKRLGLCIQCSKPSIPNRTLCSNCNRKKLEYSKLHGIEIRRAVIKHYSNGKNCCDCCGETMYEFLSIDHINGGGNRHKRERSIKRLSDWLYHHDFPDGFRVLCHNCNQAIGYYGYCPHEREL